jgi:hypothetical protein
MSTYLADRIRTIALDPTYLALSELPALAAQVERMERALDEVVGKARATELLGWQGQYTSITRGE